MDHYSAITMNKVQIDAAAWVSLEKRKPDPKKHKSYDLVYMKCPQQANPKRQKVDY